MPATNERIPVGDRVFITTRGKKKIYLADFWYQGQHKKQSLRTRNKKVAIDRALKIAGELVEGKYRPVADDKPIVEGTRLFLDYHQTEGRRAKTLSKYRGELRIFAEFCDTQRIRMLSQISPSLFDRFRAERRKNRAAKTLYTGGNILKSFMKWCVSRNYLENNPLQPCKLRRPPPEPKPAPSLEQVRQILAASSESDYVLLSVLAYTGMRSGDLQRLRREDVDLKGNWFHIVSRRGGGETKSGLSRKVPIHPILRSLLQHHVPANGQWFFTSAPSHRYPHGQHWVNPKRLNERLESTLTALGLPAGRRANGFVVHSFRNFFETFCNNHGIPQRVIDTWLGHSSDRSMAAVYYRLRDEDSQTFMQKVPFQDSPTAGIAGK